MSVAPDKAAVNATVTRVNASAIRFTYHDLDSNEAGYGPSLATWLHELGVRVESARGFAIHRSDNSVSLRWNRSVESPSVTFTTAPSRGRSGVDSAGAAIQPEWAFVPLPQHPHPTNVTIASKHSGVVGDQVLLLGEHREYRRSVGCHDVELYIPDAVTTTESPTAIADSLEATARTLDVGWRYDTVRVFGVGEPVRRGGQAFTHEVWANVNSSFTPPSRGTVKYPPEPVLASVWIHEYVHTRQRWTWNTSSSSNAQWLTEAVPTYYMISETERQGRMIACNETRYWLRLNESLRIGNNRMNLTAPSTYRDEQGAYTRGAFVLAALDAKLRSETDGKHSLEDVFRRLNQQDRVTHRSFKRAVIAVGGPEMRPWIDQYIAGTAVPAAPNVPLECHLELIPRRRDYQLITGMILLSVGTFVGVAVRRVRKWRS